MPTEGAVSSVTHQGRRFARQSVMGMGFDTLSHDEGVGEIADRAARGEGGTIATLNVDVLRQCHLDERLSTLVQSSDLVVPDGMPILWASGVAGQPLAGRFAGSDLVWTLSGAAAERGLDIFLLGGDEGVAARAAECLVDRYPLLPAPRTHCPPVGFEERPYDLAVIRAEIERAAPAIVFVGLPFKKTMLVIDALRNEFPRTWFVTVGVSFSFITGEVQRAPRWMQAIGAEWIHRLLQEPRRLFRRYIVEDTPFAVRLLAWSVRTRLSAKRQP